ncbi:hypothetical protein ACFYPT_42405 [Streptomyces sp. NPDC005529]|uniref:hypothetical protein n=1 Tax=unclassified Streptomyces TaxID=2593676 RepID=UPI0033B549B2
MHLDSVRETIQSSTTSDWHRVEGAETFLYSWYSSSAGIARCSAHTDLMTYRPDVSLSLAFGLPEREARELLPLWDRWPSKEPAIPCYADILWNGSLIDRYVFAQVDLGRAYLPWPDDGRTVSQFHAAFMKLIDESLGHRNFDRFMRQAGLEVN